MRREHAPSNEDSPVCRFRLGGLRRSFVTEAGFSLAEVAIATGLLATALVALAQLFAISMTSNRAARTTTFATVLASQKMEQLRALTYGFDNLGLPVTDTSSNVTVTPTSGSGGTGIVPSPSNALSINTSGFVDYLDAGGKSLGSGSTPQPGFVYIRRWSIEPLPTNPNNVIILQVLVTRKSSRGTTDSASPRMPEEARLVSVKARKAS